MFSMILVRLGFDGAKNPELVQHRGRPKLRLASSLTKSMWHTYLVFDMGVAAPRDIWQSVQL